MALMDVTMRNVWNSWTRIVFFFQVEKGVRGVIDDFISNSTEVQQKTIQPYLEDGPPLSKQLGSPPFISHV